ncbi:ArnT family glycosyltransferase [Vaginella massiliensis]|uniref:ArnT family glycosyltransferase n=1 Tax=Vaginella massiliensis TaxID=1816680 RepID=UPI000AD5AC90|nr:glycosyltransferase family 39 protein [Vaginella massiliensis]
MKTELKHHLFLAFVTLGMLLLNLGITPTNIMEARNLISAREIIQNNEWIFTTLNGLPRYEKPPLPTWITAIFGRFFGFDNLYFLRLPVVLITMVMVFYFYHLVKHFSNHFQAYISSLILITSFYIFFAGRDNNWDIYAHSFVVVCLFYTFISLKKNFYPYYRYYLVLLAIVALAASIMSKGPVALYALYLPFFGAYFICYGKKPKGIVGTALIITVLGAVLGSIWMYYVSTHDPKMFGNAATTEVSRWGSYNIRPFYYYWSFFTQSGIWTLVAFISLLYPYMIKRVEDKKAYRFAWFWTIFSLLLLSIIPEKKTRYILPTLIPLAFCSSFYIQFLWSNFKTLNKKDSWIAKICFGIIGVVGCLLVALIPYTIYSNQFSFWSVALTVSGLLFGIAIFRGLKHLQFSNAFYGLILLMLSVVAFGYPLMSPNFDNPHYTSREFIHNLEHRYQIKTYESNGFVPELVFLYGNSIPVIDRKENVSLPKEKRFGLLVEANDTVYIDSIFGDYRYKKLIQLDLNKANPKTPFYNKRLQRDYYLVEKPNK